MRSAVVILALAIAVAPLAGCTGRLVPHASHARTPLSIEVDPPAGDAATTFRFAAQGAGDARLLWDFGDGSRAEGAEVRHRYGFTNGTVLVRVTAADGGGARGTAAAEVRLGTGENAPPTANLTTPDPWVQAGIPARFDASASRDPDADPLRYAWSYFAGHPRRPHEEGPAHDHAGAHDGSHGGAATPGEIALDERGPVAEPSFPQAGNYTVRVRVTDPKGGESVADVRVRAFVALPDRVFEAAFEGALLAGTAGSGAGAPAREGSLAGKGLDSLAHAYEIAWPGETRITLHWNGTAADLDLRVLDARTGDLLAEAATRGPGVTETLALSQEAGSYRILVEAHAGAAIEYRVAVRSDLRIDPDAPGAPRPG